MREAPWKQRRCRTSALGLRGLPGGYLQGAPPRPSNHDPRAASVACRQDRPWGVRCTAPGRSGAARGSSGPGFGRWQRAGATQPAFARCGAASRSATPPGEAPPEPGSSARPPRCPCMPCAALSHPVDALRPPVPRGPTWASRHAGAARQTAVCHPHQSSRLGLGGVPEAPREPGGRAGCVTAQGRARSGPCAPRRRCDPHPTPFCTSPGTCLTAPLPHRCPACPELPPTCWPDAGHWSVAVSTAGQPPARSCRRAKWAALGPAWGACARERPQYHQGAVPGGKFGCG